MAARSSLVARCARPLDRPSVGVARLARGDPRVLLAKSKVASLCALREGSGSVMLSEYFSVLTVHGTMSRRV